MIEVTEEDMKMLEWADKNFNWIQENWDGLKKKYPNKWVAVYDGNILTSSEDFDEVLETVRNDYANIEKFIKIDQIRTKPLSCQPWHNDLP